MKKNVLWILLILLIPVIVLSDGPHTVGNGEFNLTANAAGNVDLAAQDASCEVKIIYNIPLYIKE